MPIFDYPLSESPQSTYQPHPVIEGQLLDVGSWIWNPRNPFLRFFPDDLRYCLGERALRTYDPALSKSARAQAKVELGILRAALRRYFKWTGRRPGRPAKLSQTDRDRMPAEYRRLMTLVLLATQNRRLHFVPKRTLNQLFTEPEFLKRLFEEFPCRVVQDPRAWTKFFRHTLNRPLKERCLRYLALQYGVSVFAIQQAIWPRRKTG